MVTHCGSGDLHTGAAGCLVIGTCTGTNIARLQSVQVENKRKLIKSMSMGTGVVVKSF